MDVKFTVLQQVAQRMPKIVNYCKITNSSGHQCLYASLQKFEMKIDALDYAMRQRNLDYAIHLEWHNLTSIFISTHSVDTIRSKISLSCLYILIIHTISLNTQSCIKGLLVVWDFFFWAVWAAQPVHKKKLGADFENLLRVFFSCFQGKKKKSIVFENTVASEQKICIINQKLYFLF